MHFQSLSKKGFNDLILTIFGLDFSSLLEVEQKYNGHKALDVGVKGRGSTLRGVLLALWGFSVFLLLPWWSPYCQVHVLSPFLAPQGCTMISSYLTYSRGQAGPRVSRTAGPVARQPSLDHGAIWLLVPGYTWKAGFEKLSHGRRRMFN